MTLDELKVYIHQLMPDADVSVAYRKGTMDHLSLQVLSDAFQGLSLLDRQRLVYQALNEPMQARRIKAIAVKTDIKGAASDEVKALPSCEP